MKSLALFYLQNAVEGHTAEPLLGLHALTQSFFCESWSSPSLKMKKKRQLFNYHMSMLSWYFFFFFWFFFDSGFFLAFHSDYGALSSLQQEKNSQQVASSPSTSLSNSPLVWGLQLRNNNNSLQKPRFKWCTGRKVRTTEPQLQLHQFQTDTSFTFTRMRNTSKNKKKKQQLYRQSDSDSSAATIWFFPMIP